MRNTGVGLLAQSRTEQAGIAVQFGSAIHGVDTGTDAELLVDAIGDVRVDIEGQQLGITGTGTRREGLGVFGRETVVGEEANTPCPLIIERLDKIGCRYEGGRRNA